VPIEHVYKGKKLILVDTSGLERKLRNKLQVEKKCEDETLKALKFSQVVVLMIDALKAFQVHDFSIAHYIYDEGRPFIAVVNKWDLVPESFQKKCLKFMHRQFANKLGIVKDLKIFTISAKTGLNLDQVMDEALNVYEK